MLHNCDHKKRTNMSLTVRSLLHVYCVYIYIQFHCVSFIVIISPRYQLFHTLRWKKKLFSYYIFFLPPNSHDDYIVVVVYMNTNICPRFVIFQENETETHAFFIFHLCIVFLFAFRHILTIIIIKWHQRFKSIYQLRRSKFTRNLCSYFTLKRKCNY